jgi:hypothetical protein
MPPDLHESTEAMETMMVMPVLVEKMDALSTQVIQLVSLVESQMWMPTQSMAQEGEEEIVEFLSP